MSFLDKMFSGAALALRSRTSDVDVSESDEPLPGDVLTAVDRATARWLPPPTGGGGGSVDAVARAAAAAAQSTANHADSAAAAAQSTANAAQGIALSASSDAAAAQSTANTANTAAATAQSTASAASSAASSAQSTANTALANAATAQTTANAASSAASTAQTTANAASSAASTAQSTANSAASSAAAAQTTANTASSDAAAAQGTANTALANAATAQSTANAAVPKALYDPNTVLVATADNTPFALTMPPSTMLARLASGDIVAATVAQIKALLALVKGDVGLGSVTNDAQLKRSANDFNTFTLKTAPTGSDLLLIENAADSGNKYYVQLSAIHNPSLLFNVATDINPTHWYRGDNTVSTAGLVDTIVDAGTVAKNFTQSGAARCPVGTDANGRIYLAPDGAVDFYQAGVAADWKFLNDGSPWTIMMVIHRTAAIAANEAIVDTTDNTTGSTGAFVTLAQISATVQGAFAGLTTSTAGSYLLQVRHFVLNTSLQVIVVRHTGYGTDVTTGARAQPIDMQLRRQGVLVGASGIATAASPAPYANTNPSNTMTLFRRSSTSGFFFGGRLYDLIIHNGALSDRQVLGYESYARAQYGVAI